MKLSMTIQDSSTSIIASSKRFFSGTLISRMTGLAREVAMAAAFGVVPAVAAFWMAFRFAHLLRRLFGEGALHAAFVPHFESLRQSDPQKGARFFLDLSIGVVSLLLLIVVVAEAILAAFLLFGSLSEGNREIIRLTMLLLPALIFISLYALNTSLLNCEQSYFLPSVAPTALNLTWVAAVVLLWRLEITEAMHYLAMILVFAFAGQWLITLPRVYHFLKGEFREEKSAFSSREILKILRPFMLGMVGVAATQVNSALDAIFARVAMAEGPAFLWYALRIQQLPLALFGIALSGALLPPISRALQNGDHSRYRDFLNFALKRTLALMIPLTVGIFVLGFSGINLIYGHGAFSNSATLETTKCLFAYGAGLLPMTLVLIFASAFFAQKNYKIPALCSLGTVVMNVALNSLFVFGLGWGAISVAIATTLTASINAFLLAYYLGGLPMEGVLPVAVKGLLFSAVGAIVALSWGAFMGDVTLSWLAGDENLLFPRSIKAQLLIFSSQALIYGVIGVVPVMFGGRGTRTQQEC